MGSSGEEPNKAIDATAGGLVWVRRRNGSWWPGKILSPAELPEGCVPTPRSGTPVKLLGREDASVDWYNLEKSKRVKAFHCGEYDDCIKKVKESASHLSKKGAKYARREDAILHALELERTHLGLDHPELSSIRITRDDESPSASHPSEESEDLDENLSSSGDDLDSVSESGKELKLSRIRNDSEDDGYGGVKRMRGLEDLGMGVAPLIKKKRSQVAHVHELMKRKNRHRPLTKVMASTTMVPVTVASDGKVSGLQSEESKINDSVVINNNLDSNGVSYKNGTLLKDNDISSGPGILENGSMQKLFDVPLVAEEQHSSGLSSVISDTSQLAHVGAHLSPSSCVEAVSLANEEQSGSGPTSSDAANIHDISQGIEQGASKWRFKGKRNSRPRKVDNEAETGVTGIDRESFLSASGHSADSKNPGQLRPSSWSWDSPEPHVPQRLLPYRQSRFTVNPKYDNSDFSLQHHVTVSGLFEVTVEVKTGYRPHHVPYISLMSKFTGRPIIGHPLTIEILEDGFISDDYTTSNSKLNHKQRARGRPPTSSRAQSSPRSRKSTPLSKKTRKLSSLSPASRRTNQEVIKPVVEKGPSIACVPLKIVFSRINAALTGSTRPGPLV